MDSTERRRRLIRAAMLTATPIMFAGGSSGAFDDIASAVGYEIQTGHYPGFPHPLPSTPPPAPTPRPQEQGSQIENAQESSKPPLDLSQHAIVLGGIVEKYEKTSEGSLIEVLEPAWWMILQAISIDPAAIHQLKPEQMEELIAACYRKAGFDEVTLTPRSGDFGRDVIAVRRGWGSVRIFDQVKAYSPGHLVPADDIRSLLHVVASDRNATKGVLTTTSAFAPRVWTDPTIAPYLPHKLELVDGSQLNQRLLQMHAEGAAGRA